MVDRPALRVVAALSVGLVLVAGGCSPTTRLPTIFPSPGDSNSRSFNVHDPLPETDIAPDMGARPPGFMQDWSEPRRTREAQGALGVPPGGGGQGPGAPMVPGGPVPGGPVPGGPVPGGPMVAPPGQPIGPGPSSQMYPDAVPQ